MKILPEATHRYGGIIRQKKVPTSCNDAADSYINSGRSSISAVQRKANDELDSSMNSERRGQGQE
jgi:hypothetical protein